jgi:hypothetical protein
VNHDRMKRAQVNRQVNLPKVGGRWLGVK